MSLSSTATLASLALVVAAGAGYAATAPSAADDAPAHTRTSTTHHHSATPAVTTLAPPRLQTKPPPAVPDVIVEVYNNSDIPGLADAAATTLTDAGWQVAGPDSWYGNIPDNTVYYPPQLQRQAKRLATVLHIDRLHPAVSPMKFDRLTVILTHS